MQPTLGPHIVADAMVDGSQVLLWQRWDSPTFRALLAPVAVHLDEGLQAEHAVRQRVVHVRVEHDDGKGQPVGVFSGPEAACILVAESIGKLLHDAVNLLRLAGKAEVAQQAAQRRVDRLVRKVFLQVCCVLCLLSSGL